MEELLFGSNSDATAKGLDWTLGFLLDDEGFEGGLEGRLKERLIRGLDMEVLGGAEEEEATATATAGPVEDEDDDEEAVSACNALTAASIRARKV